MSFFDNAKSVMLAGKKVIKLELAGKKIWQYKNKNLLPLSVDANGNDFIGAHGNGGDGFEYGYKLSCSNANGTTSALAGAYVTGFMPVSSVYDVIRIKNVTLSSSSSVNNIIFYDENKAKVYAVAGQAGRFGTADSVTVSDDGVYSIRASYWIAKEIAYFRFSCAGISDETIVTVNEEIM